MASYLITGSSRGLGLAMAAQLAVLLSSEVNTIFATGRSESSALKKLVDSSAGRVIFVQLETTSEASIKQAVAQVEQALAGKGLDVLVNNAGIMGVSPDGIATM